MNKVLCLVAAVFLSACATLGDGFGGQKWQLAELMGKPVRTGAHLIFYTDENRVVGSGGCNRFVGAYEKGKGDRIRFSQIASTMMACEKGMEIEQKFLDVLSKTDSYVLRDGRLQLNRARMAPLAVFEAQ